MTTPFTEAPGLCGALRKPRQMLTGQKYDGHKSIHDDAMAVGLGLRAGPIEGPTHFSQFDPLLFHVFGQAWFETGCISAHYQNMVVEGEEVRSFVDLPTDANPRFVRLHAEKRDGTPVLTGSAEPCAWYTREPADQSPWGRAIMPMEMISVLLGSTSAEAGLSGRKPAVGLFAGGVGVGLKRPARATRTATYCGSACLVQRESHEKLTPMT